MQYPGNLLQISFWNPVNEIKYLFMSLYIDIPYPNFHL